jgi:hypothetical protein
MEPRLSDEARTFIEANGRGQQLAPTAACHFCRRAGGTHLYVRIGEFQGHKGRTFTRFEYLATCTHIFYDGTPWCDACYTLGTDGEVVWPSCAQCAGLRWGDVDQNATPEARARLATWSASMETVWGENGIPIRDRHSGGVPYFSTDSDSADADAGSDSDYVDDSDDVLDDDFVLDADERAGRPVDRALRADHDLGDGDSGDDGDGEWRPDG